MALQQSPGSTHYQTALLVSICVSASVTCVLWLQGFLLCQMKLTVFIIVSLNMMLGMSAYLNPYQLFVLGVQDSLVLYIYSSHYMPWGETYNIIIACLD